MSEETTTPEATENTNEATYCPEDNKIRLYVGRVPRDEYLKLRADGWVSTPKQSCDFVATWTPSRRDTALEYADYIGDEDMGPEERAADRAERFIGYREKRTDDAVGHADHYDSAPAAHGFQNAAKAERAAARHDRIADRAGDAWGKAEYWQRRTAGVISHALYKSTPGVRMGRIKVLESELRKHNADVEKYSAKWRTWQKIAAITDPDKQTKVALQYTGSIHHWGEYQHPRDPERKTSLYCLLSTERDPITGAEAVALFLSDHKEPAVDNEWSLHYKLRLAYENQMLEAQGGMLEQCEVEVGGKLGDHLIIKVNKSGATGRATSVSALGPKVGSGYHYQVSNIPGTDWAEYYFELERIQPGAYTKPTPESLKELAEVKAKIKGGKPVKAPCPLINPTDEDAERLQTLWNKRITDQFEEKKKADKYAYIPDEEPSQVFRMTQAVYSANSKGTYGRAETRGICKNGVMEPRYSNMWTSEGERRAKERGPAICQIRVTHGKNYMADRVIVLTDKPQKPLPANVWPASTPKVQEVQPVEAIEPEEQPNPQDVRHLAEQLALV